MPDNSNFKHSFLISLKIYFSLVKNKTKDFVKIQKRLKRIYSLLVIGCLNWTFQET
jgi:hypothetical protein